MWRPRLRLASEDSGGLGTRPGGIKTALRGARWTGTGQTAAKAAASSQEARTRGPKSPRWSAGGRGPLRKRLPPKGGIKTLRRPALRPLRLGRREKKEVGVPAPQRTGAMLLVRGREQGLELWSKFNEPAPQFGGFIAESNNHTTPERLVMKSLVLIT